MDDRPLTRAHVCLVSDQLLPNLIPVLAEKPDRVYLFSSPEMTQRNQHMRLRRLLEAGQVATRLCPGAPTSDLPAIHAWVERQCRRLREEVGEGEVVLNATGGTKLLSLGCVEVFRRELEGSRLRIIYTDTALRTIETVLPRRTPPAAMPSVLDVPLYLAVQGFVYEGAMSDDQEWRERARARQRLTAHLVRNADALETFFGAMNYLIHGSTERPGALSRKDGRQEHPLQRLDGRRNGPWNEALRHMVEAGLLARFDGPEIELSGAEACGYLAGRWLEEHAWLTAVDFGMEDARCGVRGAWSDVAGASGPSNEFDLVAVHANRALVVECKTAHLETEPGKTQDVISKLESLGRRAGGLFGTSMLLTARRLSGAERARCGSFDLVLRERAAIDTLGADLAAWRKGGEIPRNRRRAALPGPRAR